MILRQLVANCPPLDQGKIDELILRFLENPNSSIDYLLTPQRFIYVCHKAYQELCECGSLVHVHCPNGIYVIGDLNASFRDLIVILGSIGLPITKTIVFLGNYIDDALQALHTIMFLLLLKIRFPRRIILLRGKHEIWEINKKFGLHRELYEKYRGQGHIMYYNLNEIFDCMPLVAILSDQIYCCHGGISQFAQYRSDIANVPRKSVWPNDVEAYRMRSIFTDTIWAEPHFSQTLSYSPSDRYYSYYFNRSALVKKLRQFKCRALICSVSSNPNNMSLKINETEDDGCEELFDGFCYAIYSSHMDRPRSFKAALLAFKFNSLTSLLDADVKYHTVEKGQCETALQDLKDEFIRFKENCPAEKRTNYKGCQSCSDWRRGIDSRSFQSNRCLSHPEMLRIMMKFGGPLLAEKYTSSISYMQIEELIGYASAYAFAYFLRDLLKAPGTSKRQTTLYREVELPPYSFEWTLPPDFESWPKLFVAGKLNNHDRLNNNNSP